MKQTRGFTIVELLIVIVVIGVLAGIVTVAYGSIQMKARNAQIISLVNQWETVLRAHQATTDEFPKGAFDYVCLGGGFVASGVYATDQCMKADGWGVSTDPSMLSIIQAATGVAIPQSLLPSLTFANGGGGKEYYRGLLYLSRNGGVGITYALKGDKNTCTDGDGFFEGAGFVACRRVLSGDPYSGL